MSIFRSFPKKTLYEVSQILVNSKHESILSFIEEVDESYYLNDSIENISSFPTFQFAIACSLASLGNPEEAESIFGDPESIIASNSGDNVSKYLFNDFMA